MNRSLVAVINSLNKEYEDAILPGSRYYTEVSIGQRAESLGFKELGDKYRAAQAIIPLTGCFNGMKVRIDGRTFVNYAQFDTGVVVPGYIAEEAGLPFTTYHAKDSMILNFA